MKRSTNRQYAKRMRFRLACLITEKHFYGGVNFIYEKAERRDREESSTSVRGKEENVSRIASSRKTRGRKQRGGQGERMEKGGVKGRGTRAVQLISRRRDGGTGERGGSASRRGSACKNN